MSREDKENKQMLERLRNLSEQRKQVLAMPPEKALDRILDMPQPAALVHSFSDADLYYLIQDIGPDDALPVLSLASNRQWEYILDQEIWDKDRFERPSLTQWMSLLLRADSARFLKWLLEEKTDYIEYYLAKNIEFVVREHDQDPSDFGKGFFTFDDTLYIRFLEDPAIDVSDEKPDKDRKEVVNALLGHVAADDYKKCQSLLFESAAIVPAETEEEAYRSRNFRMAEKGFAPFEEAVGVYQPIRAEELEQQPPKFVADETDSASRAPVPFYPIDMMDDADLFSRALRDIHSTALIDQLQSEFANLCNRIAVADQQPIKAKEQLRPVVKKASGYLSIGLEVLTEKEPDGKPGKASEYLKEYALHQIFRYGFGLALALKWRAERWRRNAWFQSAELPLGFWDEDGLGVLGGLLIKKPLFYDNYKTGELYREFHSLKDIRETEARLNEIIEFDGLLSRAGIQFAENPSRFITHKSLLLTLWARSYLRLSEGFTPLALDEFKRFFDALFEDRKATDADKPRTTRTHMKESFMNWLAEISRWDLVDISRKFAETLQNIFIEIETEFGSVASNDLDSRFVRLFVLENRALEE